MYSVSNIPLKNIILTSEFVCLSRCERFGVACGTVGGLPDNPRGHLWLRGRYYDDVTVVSVYKASSH